MIARRTPFRWVRVTFGPRNERAGIGVQVVYIVSRDLEGFKMLMLMTANEAASVTGVPLRQVHRIIDAGLLQGAVKRRRNARTPYAQRSRRSQSGTRDSRRSYAREPARSSGDIDSPSTPISHLRQRGRRRRPPGRKGSSCGSRSAGKGTADRLKRARCSRRNAGVQGNARSRCTILLRCWRTETTRRRSSRLIRSSIGIGFSSPRFMPWLIHGGAVRARKLDGDHEH